MRSEQDQVEKEKITEVVAALKAVGFQLDIASMLNNAIIFFNKHADHLPEELHTFDQQAKLLLRCLAQIAEHGQKTNDPVIVTNMLILGVLTLKTQDKTHEPKPS